MNIFSKWFFYVLLIGVIGTIIAIILLFTMKNKIVGGVILALGIIFIILGIVFWVLEARKLEPVKTNSLENVLKKTPIVGDTLGESYNQAKEQAVPILKQQFKNTTNLAGEMKLSQVATGAVIGTIVAPNPVGTLVGGYVGKKLIV